MTNNNSAVDSTNSQALLNQIVVEYMREQRRKRFWRWIKWVVISLLILCGVYLFLLMRAESVSLRAKPHVGLVDVKGTIFDSQSASADNFIKGLQKAYENKGLKAIILRIDSPGGSPVQGDYMYNTVRYYRKMHPDIKIYAVCVDICASAAYYVAAAADEIYANPSSLVGSIGVIYNGFGFVDTIQKLGVTRRLQTAGSNKGFMDQFSPVNPTQQKTLQTMLDIIHQQFISKVKEGRGKRLHIDSDTFSGLFWTGIQAKERGLIDGLASSGQLARDIIKIEEAVDYTYQPSVMERVAKNIGTAMADQLPIALGMRPGIQ
jgi:protease-4